MSLTSGTCAITGTPTVTALNATYTVWANISGQSFSGQVWLEVGLNAPVLSYSPTSSSFVNGTAITEVQPINSGGEISGFDISPALPNGLSIGSTNGTIWGTPTSWEISPSLPSGLSFSSTTGDISGTPTVLQTTAVTYLSLIHI